MGDLYSIKNKVTNPSKKLPDLDSSPFADILLIGRDATTRLYTDEVLQQAGFKVISIGPWEAKNLVKYEIYTYPVIIFSHTLHPADITEIGSQMRRRIPGSKLLLIVGSDPMPVSFDLFDTVIDGLDGPKALIRKVRRLSELASETSKPAKPAATSSKKIDGFGKVLKVDGATSDGSF
jgi:hypothetical protein